MTVYIVDLESIPTRYTCQWKTHLPSLIEKHGHEVVVISGPDDLPNNTTPGMFLNFSATNIYKSVQVEKFSRLFSDGKIKNGDYFLFTDAWHPGIINLRYMADLLNVKIKIGGLWHSGSYDEWDGLGQYIGNAPWVRHAEKSFFWAIDYNYFATDFHIELFTKNLLNNGFHIKEWTQEDVEDLKKSGRIIRTGWPMEYMEQTLAPYKNIQKRDLILFPHRIAPEKQVDIFRDIAKHLPQYEFVVCQDTQLTKHEYHTLLAQSKIVFSANLQETLGISTCSEGPLVSAIPLSPNRLSYSEIFKNFQEFLYPSEWTENYDNYLNHRQNIIFKIKTIIEDYDQLFPIVQTYINTNYKNYFHSGALISNIS